MKQEQFDRITYDVIGCAYTVHSALGPGLLESAYEHCLAHEIKKKGHRVRSQVPLPLVYKSVQLDVGYRIDLFVDDILIVEIKAVDALMDIHKAQLNTYLQLTSLDAGLLMNFNVTNMQKGIHRIVRKGADFWSKKPIRENR